MRLDRDAVTFVSTWRPIGFICGAILVGLILGITVGVQSCSPAGALTGAKEDNYLVLAATLYSQGESLGAMKVYLNSYGVSNAASDMLQLADRYDKSTDRKKQQQAKDLRELGEALKLGREPEGTRTASVAVSTAAPGPAAAGGAGAATQSAGQPAAAAKAATPAPATPTPTPGPNAPALAVTGHGVTRTSSTGAVLREQPTSQSKMVGSLSNGTRVEIIKVVEGEAVDPTENRWYLIKLDNNRQGYVYFKLIGSE